MPHVLVAFFKTISSSAEQDDKADLSSVFESVGQHIEAPSAKESSATAQNRILTDTRGATLEFRTNSPSKLDALTKPDKFVQASGLSKIGQCIIDKWRDLCKSDRDVFDLVEIVQARNTSIHAM